MESIYSNYTISTQQDKLQLHAIHDFLANHSYWSKGIPLEVVKRSVEKSLCFGLYYQEEQVGFARVISDYSTMAYLADVYVLEAHRGKGLSKWLVQTVMAHPQLQDLRRWMLATADAHGLYEKYGFSSLSNPERFMEIHKPEIYIS